MKNVENRTWRHSFRGRLYIHAGSKFDDAGYAWVKEKFPEIQMPEKSEFQRGGIVGAVNIAGIIRDGTSPWAMHGQYHWICTCPTVLPFEPCRGAQGIWIAGNQRRVMELPAGFTIKTARVAHLSESEDTGVTLFTAKLYRADVYIWTTAALHDRKAATTLAMREAHRLAALPTPPEALTNETCDCQHHE